MIKYKSPTPQVSSAISIPAPTGGLNTHSPLAAMGQQYAVQLSNGIATSIGVSVRKGYKVVRSDLLNVDYIVAYNGQKVVPDRLFACDGSTSIVDVTPGATSTIATKTGYTSTKFRHATMVNQASTYLVLANGLEAPSFFNGAQWSDFSTSANPSAIGQVTLPSTVSSLTKLTKPFTHQKRLWFVIQNSTRLSYLPINGMGGQLSTIDLGGLLPRGGVIHDAISWSSDGGSGLANRLVVVSTEGDVIVIDGTDPEDATSWRVTATWQLSPPGPVPFIPFDGDVLYFGERGLYPLSTYLQSTTTAQPISVSISNTIGEMLRAFRSVYGYSYCTVPSENVLIINQPQANIASNVQYVLSTETGGFSLFTGIPAVCWATFNNKTYFGGGNKVCEMFVGYLDAVNADGTGGTAYSMSCQQAFSNLGAMTQKHVSLCRVNLLSTSAKNSLRMAVVSDFDVSPPRNVSTVPVGTSSLWQVSKWDTDTWGGSLQTLSQWQGASSIGIYHSITLVLQVQSETTWVSSDMVVASGGIL